MPRGMADFGSVRVVVVYGCSINPDDNNRHVCHEEACRLVTLRTSRQEKSKFVARRELLVVGR